MTSLTYLSLSIDDKNNIGQGAPWIGETRLKEGMMFLQAEITSALQSIPWFLELKPGQIDQIAKISRLLQFDAGEVIFSEGEKIDFFLIVLTGVVAVENHVPMRGNVCIFTAEPLDVVGWSSMTPVARQSTSTARAISSTMLIQIDAEALKLLCDQDHDLGYIIMKRLANVVASRLLVTRLQLLDIVANLSKEQPVSGI